MSDNLPSALYHVSATSGLRVFHPRRCCFDKTRQLSGMLPEGREPPAGWTIHHFVFAGDARMVRYFCMPSPMKRFSVRRAGDAYGPFVASLGVTGEPPDEVLLLEERDRAAIMAHRLSLYTFDPTPFVRYPSGEYVADIDITPLDERALIDPIAEMRSHGINPVFVEDIEGRFDACRVAGIALGLVANMVGGTKLLDTSRNRMPQ